MARRRKDEPNFINDLFDILLVVPIWAGPILAFVFFAGLRWVIPWVLSGEPDPDNLVGKTVWPMVSKFSVMIAPMMGGLVLLLWIGAEVRKLMDRNRLDRQTGIDSVRDLGWREFELLLSEACERRLKTPALNPFVAAVQQQRRAKRTPRPSQCGSIGAVVSEYLPPVLTVSGLSVRLEHQERA